MVKLQALFFRFKFSLTYLRRLEDAELKEEDMPRAKADESPF